MQARLNAEMQQKIMMEANRIAEEKMKREREEAERRAAEEERVRKIAEEAAMKATKEAEERLAIQLAKERAEAEERIRKQQEEIERHRKELEEAARKAEEERKFREEIEAAARKKAEEEKRLKDEEASKKETASSKSDDKSSVSIQMPPPIIPISTAAGKPSEELKLSPAPEAKKTEPASTPAGELKLASAAEKKPEEKKTEEKKPEEKKKIEDSDDKPLLTVATQMELKRKLESLKLGDKKTDAEKKDEKPGEKKEEKSGEKKDEKAGEKKDEKKDETAKKNPFGLPPPGAKKKGAAAPGKAPGAKPAGAAASATDKDKDKDKKEGDKGKPATAGDKKPPTKTQTKIGDVTYTNSTLIKLQQKKQIIIYTMTGVAVLIICILVFFVVQKIAAVASKALKATQPAPVMQPQVNPQQAQPTNGVPAQKNPNYTTQGSSGRIPTDLRVSPLYGDYTNLATKLKKMPWGSRAEIDVIIKEYRDFISAHSDTPANDPCIEKANGEIKKWEETKSLFK